MANRLKGITLEIGGDTTSLSKSLSGVNKEIKDTQSQLKDVQKLLKLDPTNVDLLKQKQKLLSDQIRQTNDKLKELKKAQETMDANGVDKNSAQYQNLQREIIDCEQSLRGLERAAQQSNVVLEQVGAVAGKVADGANKVADATRGLSAAAGGALVAIGGMAYKSMTAADDLTSMAKQTGFTTDELQKFQYAADLVDVSVSDITGAAAKMKKGMDEAGIAVGNVTVRTVDAAGRFRSVNDIFYDVVAALGQVANETERDQIAMQIFGKSADQLAGIIDDGGAALKAYGQEAEELGLILSGDTLNGLNAVNDQFDRLKAQAKARFMEAGAKALEAALPLLESIVGIVERILNFIGSLDAGQIKVLGTILLIVAAISPVASMIATIAGAISTLAPIIATVVGALGGFAALIPVIAGLVGFLAYQFAFHFDEIKEGAKMTFDEIKSDIMTIVDAFKEAGRIMFDAWAGLFSALGQLFTGIGEGIKSAFNSVISWVMSGLNAVMNAIRSVASAIGGLFGGSGGGMSAGGLPMFANGGTLRSGSAIVGEAGPELLTVAGGKATVTPMTATIDSKSMAALSNAGSGAQKVSVNVNFTGSLAQLAAVLQPAITAETSRQGLSLAR